jgi:hypothetical protein
MARSAREVLKFDFGEREIRALAPLQVRHGASDVVFVAAGALFTPDGPRVGKEGWLDYEFLSRLDGASNMTAEAVLSYAHGAVLPSATPSPGSAFRRYYDVFLQNSLRGRPFRIRLKSGEIADGIPTSGSIVNPADPNASFAFRIDTGARYRVPFEALAEVVPIEPALAGTLREQRAAAGSRDLTVKVPKDSAEGLMHADSGVVVLSVPWAGTSVAPTHLYRFLVVEGRGYDAADIRPLDQRVLQVVASPFAGESPWL